MTLSLVSNVISSFLLQASALEERLHKTEVELKKSQEEAQKNILHLNDANSQLVSYGLFFIISHVTWMSCQEQLTWCSLEDLVHEHVISALDILSKL